MNLIKPTDKDTYAVIGNPIDHSKSPEIHALFAENTNQPIEYHATLAPLDGFENTIKDMIALGYKGVNITVPFKHEAAKLCDVKSYKAYMAGAVNTMTFIDGKIHGDNTDGDGILKDIQSNLGFPVNHKRVLILGAGGAGEGVFQTILNEHPAMLTIANRTPEKAKNIVEKFSHHSMVCHACGYEDLDHQSFDIIINATSTGLSDTALPIPDSVFAEGSLAYDMVYAKETLFMQQARAAGATVADGLGMLVEQAALAFKIWRKVEPDTQAVMQTLRK